MKVNLYRAVSKKIEADWPAGMCVGDSLCACERCVYGLVICCL